MNVLSLFDGMSCGQLALRKAGIPYEKYFASETDPHCIKVTQANFPATRQSGDVRDVKGSDLPRIDLLMGGSPCQGFSIAGSGLNFEDPRSKLFFEFLRLKKETNPRWFLLENVKMKKEWRDIISERLGVEPLLINSSLVSAQNRERLYWTNISVTSMPADRNTVLIDILEYNNVRDHDSIIKINPKTGIGVIWNTYKSGGQNGNVYSIWGKCKTLSAGVGIKGNGIGSSNAPKIEADAPLGWRRLTPVECERLQTVPDGYTKDVTNTQRYKMIGNAWTVDVIAHILSNLVRCSNHA